MPERNSVIEKHFAALPYVGHAYQVWEDQGNTQLQVICANRVIRVINGLDNIRAYYRETKAASVEASTLYHESRKVMRGFNEKLRLRAKGVRI